MSQLAAELRRLIRGEVRRKEPLHKHTSFRIGGPAEVLVLPRDEESLRRVVVHAHTSGSPLYVLGGGTNVLVPDDGLNGVVIRTTRCLKALRIEGESVIAGAGIALPRLAALTVEAGLSGLEFACGIPGTLGGGLVGNAGAHGRSLADVVTDVWGLDPEGREIHLTHRECGFGYRRSTLGGALLITCARLALSPGDRDKGREMMEAYLRWRRSHQPLGFPSAGSVFRNPPEGPSAGALIDRAGLKGYRLGGAQISELHANFIVNRGGATAQDVLSLIALAQREVKKQFGVTLELELTVL